ncbi:hypothetical protein F7Q91_03225 [Vibrio chagasii]|uniref:Uncharacterized protein n=2 Tax=Vibrio chagasii TaxID=170679 RepID=A0A7V7NX39_9VIBR|nr:hypothetical protein [Vibrio chagasii]KAB0482434.1 hypothetical protein F7Q91_03225 [Vibrio chagasii]
MTECELTDRKFNKAKWLTMCSKALGFDDWGALQNLSKSFSNNSPSLVFTPTTIDAFAIKLRNTIGDPNIELEHLKQAIISTGTNEEKNLFGVAPDFKLMGPTEYIIEFGADPLYEFPLLKWLWCRRNFDEPEKKILGYYLDEMKHERKGLTRAEIKEKCLDVYAKHGHKITDIVEGLIGLGYVERFDGRSGRSLRVSERGAGYFIRELTGDHNLAWSSWWTKFQSLFQGVPYKSINSDWNRYILSFCMGETPEEAAENCSWDQVYIDSSKLVEKAITAQTSHTHLPTFPNFRAFHFLPRLMLSQDIQNTRSNDINFNFEGPDWCGAPDDHKLKKLWANPRNVGVQSLGHRGWISIIPEAVTEFTVIYRWSSKSRRFRNVEHHMTYVLQPDTNTVENWFYGVNIGNDKKHNNRFFDSEHSFTSLLSLTHGQSLSKEEILELDRVKAGIRYLEITGEKVLIKERRTLTASNQFESVGAFN